MEHKPVYKKKATTKTPEVILLYDDVEDAIRLSIKGRCIPENPIEFFAPLIERLKNKIKQFSSKDVHLILDIEYINSISIKFMIKILTIFTDFVERKDMLKVDWYYEDEDTFEVGSDLAYITGLEFNFIEK